ncbi:sugar phosphate isomerase/epimerase family protein [Streptomyces sp. NPDC051740]|uniref:sugar phosphate isomerase/epimerase family protein n=1 Tax=Streptomyces sp. NPDC051740 TaxID=3365673 RepID=UPI0037948D2D
MNPRLVLQTGIYGYGILGQRAETDLEGTLDAIRTAGYDGLEVMSSLLGDPARLRDACAERGLDTVAVHLFWHELDDFSWETLRELACDRLILSGLPVDSVASTLDTLPALRDHVARAADVGARVAVHNHEEEARPLHDGRTPLEILCAETAPEELGFVVDLHWASVAGALERTLKATAGRCDYLHIKDGLIADPEAPHSFDLGTGEVELVHGWSTARSTGTIAVTAVERAMPAPDLPAALQHDAEFTRQLWHTGTAQTEARP